MARFTHFLKSYNNSDFANRKWYEDRDILYKLFNLKGLSVLSIDDMLSAISMGERYMDSEHIEIRLFGYEIKEVASIHIADIVILDKNRKVRAKAKEHHMAKRG